ALCSKPCKPWLGAMGKRLKSCKLLYRICLRYILGFSEDIHIEKNNIRLFDTLPYAEKGSLKQELTKLYHQ
ncbi:hypothetical protein, partial [Mitsuokella jalaludinii]|uniref:hypothetical protein n=1 Tax=Mitsuokella jalaludinii TaxID=187979 RepID=UPI00298CC7C5